MIKLIKEIHANNFKESLYLLVSINEVIPLVLKQKKL